CGGCRRIIISVCEAGLVVGCVVAATSPTIAIAATVSGSSFIARLSRNSIGFLFNESITDAATFAIAGDSLVIANTFLRKMSSYRPILTVTAEGLLAAADCVEACVVASVTVTRG